MAESATADLQQSLQQQRDKTQAIESELATARREVEAQAAVLSKKNDEAAQRLRVAEAATARLRQSVQQERARGEALAGELAKAQREAEAQLTLSRKKDDEVAQLKRAAETAAENLQQSLLQQRDKTLALESELAMARRGVETEPATSQNAADESAQLKQTPNNAQAELRGSSAGLPRAAPNPPPR